MKANFNKTKNGTPSPPLPFPFLPQLATLVSKLPEVKNWISEIKWDGYRLIASVNNGNVVLTTRRGYHWTRRFPSIARDLAKLPCENAVLDGEVVVLNPDGTADFQKLQDMLDSRRIEGYVYYIFDLPHFENRDLTDAPLIERKDILRKLLEASGTVLSSVRYNDHVEGSGERISQSACRYKAEGIIAKRIDRPNVRKRTRNWVKKKCVNRQEFVVGGFTKDTLGNSFFGSLVLGY